MTLSEEGPKYPMQNRIMVTAAIDLRVLGGNVVTKDAVVIANKMAASESSLLLTT